MRQLTKKKNTKTNREDSLIRKRKLPRQPTAGGGGLLDKKSVTVVGMETEQAALSRACFSSACQQSPVRVCFLEGEAGSGKTRLVEWVLKETTARRVIVSSGDSSETNTPFFVWRQILQNILAITRAPSIGTGYGGGGAAASAVDALKSRGVNNSSFFSSTTPVVGVREGGSGGTGKTNSAALL